MPAEKRCQENVVSRATPAATVRRTLVRAPFHVREIEYDAGFRQARHTHPTMSVSLILAGAIRECACSREEVGSALSVVVKPAGIEHSDEIGPRGARTLQVAFDADAAGGLLSDHADLARWRWLHGRPVAAALLSVLRATLAPGATDADALEDRIVDALGGLGDAPLPARGEPPRWLRNVKEALDDEVHVEHSIRELARTHGAHPVSLSRAFARHFGCSITDYRRRARLRRAATSIEGSLQDISRIAHDAGYADHPHLCREFRTVVGMSPTVFRNLARGG